MRMHVSMCVCVCVEAIFCILTIGNKPPEQSIHFNLCVYMPGSSLLRASVFSGSRIVGSRIGGSRDMHAQLDFEHWEIFIP